MSALVAETSSPSEAEDATILASAVSQAHISDESNTDADYESGRVDTSQSENKGPLTRSQRSNPTSITGTKRARTQSRQIRSIKLVTGQRITPKYLLTNAYRDLLNDTIETARDRRSLYDDGDLGNSWVGGSWWTAHEKAVLFGAISRDFSVDTGTLSSALQTKSESEVCAYLNMLLEESTKQHTSEGRRESKRTFFEVPAAFEVSDECNAVLEVASSVLAKHIDEHDALSEQERSGNRWLIDEPTAAAIDAAIDTRLWNEESQALEIGGSTRSPAPGTGVNTHELDNLDAAERLLRPSAFLSLSRHLFMNSSESDNFQNMAGALDSDNGPALYRSAFNEFYKIAVNFTRRLMLAALFQARSRLRAQNAEYADPVHAQVLRDVDVHTACELLNLKRDAQEYWAGVSRRCRVAVYTTLGRYSHGQKAQSFGSQYGYPMSHDEVELELGTSSLRNFQAGDAAGTVASNDLSSDLADTGSASHVESSSYTDFHAGESPSDGTDSEGNDTRARKRRRKDSADTFLETEEKYLEARDMQASRQQEEELWKALRLIPPDEIRSRRDSEVLSSPLAVPRTLDCQMVDWRQHTQYESPWERPEGQPPANAFLEMEHRGRIRRELRGLARREIGQERTHGKKDHSDQSNSTTVQAAEHV